MVYLEAAERADDVRAVESRDELLLSHDVLHLVKADQFRLLHHFNHHEPIVDRG